MKAVKARCKIWKKENKQRSSYYNFNIIVYFLEALLFTEIFSLKSTIHLVIFLRQHYVWADSVFPWMNTIASHDQMKPIRIKENLVVNCIDI